MKSDKYVKVGKVGDFPPGRGRLVRARDRAVAVFRVGERWFALQDACPHMGASLADGELDGLRVTCRWHGWKFDLRDGQGDRREWARARVHEIKIEGDDVLVGPAAGPEPPGAPPEEDEDWIVFDPDRHLKKL